MPAGLDQQAVRACLWKPPQLRPSYWSSPRCCFGTENIDQILDTAKTT
ncbi:MAG: hypothetical protein KTR25_16460 [Myxococcales bacterium]|nr:hypothetical protein [Myxococcales bacterium]